jgi:hypothetical protein
LRKAWFNHPLNDIKAEVVETNVERSLSLSASMMPLVVEMCKPFVGEDGE